MHGHLVLKNRQVLYCNTYYNCIQNDKIPQECLPIQYHLE